MLTRPRMPLSMWRVPPWPATDSVRLSNPPVILLYHSVCDVNTDPFGIRVSPRNFAEQMAVIAAHCRPMRLDRLHDALRTNDVPPRSVVVTFDDGFADNLLHAKPILERHKIPATIFVASGLVDQTREYWWDELDRILLQPGRLPRNLDLRLEARGLGREESQPSAAVRAPLTSGLKPQASSLSRQASSPKPHAYSIDLGDDAAFNTWQAIRGRHRHWKAWNADYPTARHRAYHELWELMHRSTSEARDQALDDLRDWAGMDRRGRPERLCCTTAQLKQLAVGDLIEIGAHTITHPSLAAIPLESQREEIAGSKTQLEAMLGRAITSFAYPYGTRDDFTADTVQLLHDGGFARACSNFPAIITPQTDHFQWPRRVVNDWNGEEFTQRLAKWFEESQS